MNQQKPMVKISKDGPYIASGNLPLGKEIIGTNEGGESNMGVATGGRDIHPKNNTRDAAAALVRTSHFATAHIRKPDLTVPKPRAANRI